MRPSLHLFAVALLAGGCAAGPDYQEPEMAVPDVWYQGISRDIKPRGSKLEEWWSAFNDPVLNQLIDRTREANPTLKLAAASVREARARRGEAASLLFPMFNAGGSYTRTKTSENVIPTFPGFSNPSNLYAVGFDAGWEIDVFGGTRRLVEAAEAGIGAASETYRDVLISLYAETALNYVQTRTLEERLRLVRANIELQRGSVQLTRDRFDAGLVPEFDVSQAESNLYQSESLVPALESQLTLTRNILAVLAGGYPGSQDDLLRKSGKIPAPPRGFGYGLPADLLRSRPDIRRAERALAAQTALIGVAVSELYPKFTLVGDFGFAALDSSDWLESDSRTWGFGPSFRWNIFSAGRIRNSIKAEEARTEQALYGYENTVLGAVAEVETAMVAIVKEQQRLQKLRAGATATEKTVKLVRDNYTAGLINFQNLLDAERSLVAAQDAAAASEGLVSANYIRLFKALGGGAPVEEPSAADLQKMDGK